MNRLTAATRTGINGNPYRIFLVRIGDDIAGHVYQGERSVFGSVLDDPDADDGVGANGHTSIGYCLAGINRDAMAERVAESWGKDPVTALRGTGVGGWPLLRVNGRDATTCPHCGEFRVSSNAEEGRGVFAYCHACGKASDR